MKIVRSSILVLVLALLLQGCSAIDTAYTSRMLFNQSMTDITTARQANVIDAATFKNVVTAGDAVVPVLDELDRNAAAGDGIQFWRIYWAERPQLQKILAEALAARSKKAGAK